MNELKHVGIITDGNGRWATKRGLPRTAGHDEGKKTFHSLCEWALKIGIPYLSFFVLSTDNLKRNPAEVEHIYEIAREIVSKGGIDWCKQNGIRLIYAGDREGIKADDREALEKGEQETAACDKLIVVLYTRYGGREEIVRAARMCVEDGVEITEDAITDRLYASPFGVPVPDLILRTGGYTRLSGYLPWQTIYSELYFTETLFPDLSYEEFAWACKWFERIERTHGGDRQEAAISMAVAELETTQPEPEGIRLPTISLDAGVMLPPDEFDQPTLPFKRRE